MSEMGSAEFWRCLPTQRSDPINTVASARWYLGRKKSELFQQLPMRGTKLLKQFSPHSGAPSPG